MQYYGHAYATVVDCGSTGPFYNGFKEEYSTLYGAVIKFSSVSALSCIILLIFVLFSQLMSLSPVKTQKESCLFTEKSI